MTQINELKAKCEKQKQLLKGNESEISKNIEKIDILENELKSLRETHKTLELQSQENAKKSSEYKIKLKNAISVIQELNKVLIECTKKPEVTNCSTQTDHFKSEHAMLQHKPVKSTVSMYPMEDRTLEKENILLADIFFRPKPFVESELFSMGDGFSQCLERLL
ncbi:unnamed protein product [Acanthoscelides obtectus]|uniref:Uncharacterized protein n=1 Tax=Acanthoscelides obtectus TaxID=200917 RepID=A0A9P0M463_ACAOB|nr:unnamed protein product [Acanthoscelides obtectus]CAK1641731.1 hypothetical protein AOBTE_LOCUS12593 [Acanthoscelides obtectus]